MQYIELSLHRPAGAVMIFTRPVGEVMIFTRSRNAATGDNSMNCMIPDPFPSSAFGKGSATPDYILSREKSGTL